VPIYTFQVNVLLLFVNACGIADKIFD